MVSVAPALVLSAAEGSCRLLSQSLDSKTAGKMPALPLHVAASVRHKSQSVGLVPADCVITDDRHASIILVI